MTAELSDPADGSECSAAEGAVSLCTFWGSEYRLRIERARAYNEHPDLPGESFAPHMVDFVLNRPRTIMLPPSALGLATADAE